MPETEIKHLIQNLGESIYNTLDGSPKIHERIKKIQEAGYEVFLVLEAKTSLSDKKKDEDVTTTTDEAVRLRITQDDVKFLKSLKISADNEY
jgi:hypothetical protein